MLGVSRDASAAEVRRAYRALALRWHPDKAQPDDKEEVRAGHAAFALPAPPSAPRVPRPTTRTLLRAQAERRFIEVAAAYEILSDDRSRAAYDRGGSALVARQAGGGADAFGGGDFGLFRASTLFRENFGEALAADWYVCSMHV